MSVLATSAKGASFLILFQVASRGFTFLVNQVLLRFLSLEVLGLSAQLDLYSITVLFFSRESIRVACQRQANSAQTVVNLAFISIFLGGPFAYALAILYTKAESPNVPYFVESLIIYGISAFIELLSEPAFMAAQQMLLFKIRASTETVATVGRCIATCGFAIWAARMDISTGVLPFAVGQLAYSILLFLFYTFQVSRLQTSSKFSLLPKRISNNSNHYFLGVFSVPLCRLGFSLSVQNSFKYFLTQGDGMLIAALASLSDQGAYALASNYGGLIARMLFQPIEETSRNIFGHLCNVDYKEGEREKSKTDLQNAKSLLQNILRLYNILGIVACAVGPTAAPILLKLVAGSRWSGTDATIVLVSYCYYIPLLAINGVTEGFVAATASNTTLNIQSALMGICFIAFAASTYVFMHVMELGASGLVYANCVNMALRIMFNSYFIKSYFKNRDLLFYFSSTSPTSLSIATAVATWAILRSRAIPAHSHLQELTILAGTIAFFVSLLALFERDFILPWIEPFIDLKFVKSKKTEPHESVKS